MRVVVVGSGASGVHAAQTLLERGADVTLVDAGRTPPSPPVRPEESFERLKETLEDPADYFLGSRFESVAWPRDAKEYYGFPPNKLYVFEGVDGFRHVASGFTPLLSFARGGLAETWTAGAFPFHDAELADFPWAAGTLAPYYDRVAERIGIGGVQDDLAEVVPTHAHLEEPLRLDEGSRLLLDRATARRGELRSRAGCLVGRSRVATLSRRKDSRPACTYLGRCLVGCPTGALYTPSMTLARCLEHPRFDYRGGRFALRLELDASRRATALFAEPIDGGAVESYAADAFVFAAGTLATSKLVLDTWRRATGETVRLGGLLDNRQVLVPFLNPGMIGRSHDPNSYQYHQVALAFLAPDPRDAIHGLVTTLKTAMIHPIVKSLPFDLPTSLALFRDVHAALGLVNVNFPDRRREECGVAVEDAADGARDATGTARTTLRIRYVPQAGENARIAAGLARVRRALALLGCFVPPGMSHVRPMGASVHYAGTIPMAREGGPWTATPGCRSRAISNLWFADGTTFPFLPAKNLTLTLMANATRVAEAVAREGIA